MIELFDEPVTVTPWDPAWSAASSVEAAHLRRVLGPGVEVVHIGSTAVPHLAARPVIDLMVGAENADHAATIVGNLQQMGYGNLGDCGVAGQICLQRRDGTALDVYVVETAGERWHANLALRDYLRADDAARARYAASKHRAIAEGANTRTAYSASKAGTVAQLVAEARTWAAQFSPEAVTALQRAGVTVAWLFGSRGRGDHRPQSDADVAVLGARPLDLLTEGGLAVDLADALGVARADVVDVARASLELRGRALVEGQIVFCADDALRTRYEERTRRDWFDFKPTLERLSREWLEHVASEGLRDDCASTPRPSV